MVNIRVGWADVDAVRSSIVWLVEVDVTAEIAQFRNATISVMAMVNIANVDATSMMVVAAFAHVSFD